MLMLEVLFELFSVRLWPFILTFFKFLNDVEKIHDSRVPLFILRHYEIVKQFVPSTLSWIFEHFLFLFIELELIDILEDF